MTIQVLGSGCLTCKKLYEAVKEAASELQINETVKYIAGAEGIQKIVELGAMSSPVLTVNGKIALVGFTANIEELKGIISKAGSSNSKE